MGNANDAACADNAVDEVSKNDTEVGNANAAAGAF
jgi:hypothetical protein